ncbi:MAG: transcriptional regulator, LysR family [Rhodospirillales bacterium]|nr:transcriptional regulator, LysR family [Rhodospirillales bacterium]
MDYLAAIRLFVRAHELGSFSKAAADCGAKVSSVSRAVAALEADLGVALFNRSTRRLNPTEAGGDFYERAVRILVEVEDARQQTAALNGRPQGLLKLNLPGAFGRRHVVPLLPGFLKAYPDIRIEATLTDATVNLIEAGADVAIRIGALPDSALVAKKLAPHRRVLCASPAYLAGRAAPAHPPDIAGENCLGFALQPADRWFFERGAERVEVAIKGTFKANDSEALLDVALAGLGVALLPTWLVGEVLRSGRLVPLLPGWTAGLAPGDRAIWGVYPPKKILSPKVRVFLDHIEAGFGRPAVWDR